MRPIFTFLMVGMTYFSICNTSVAFEYVKLTHFSTDDGLNQSNINNIIQDKDGYIWVSSMQGVNRYDGYRITEVHSPNNILLTNYVELLFEDSHGIIWIGADPEHNYQLDKDTNQLTEVHLTAPIGYKLEYETFNNAVEDKLGNIWFSTFNEIYFYDRKQHSFKFILSSADLLEDQEREEIFRDLLLLDNQLLMATSKGLFKLDIESNEARLVLHAGNSPLNRDQNNIKSLLQNQYGNILVGTVEGLYEIERIKSNHAQLNKHGKIILPNLNIWKIIEKSDFYWLATDEGLFRLTKQGELNFVFKYSDTPHDTSDDDIVTMFEDREGNLWFGSRSDGMFKWRPNKAIKNHFTQHGENNRKLSDNNINATIQTPDGTIWVATENGINRINPDTKEITNLLVNPNKKEVLSESTFYEMAYNNGKLWVNGNAGIQIIDEVTLKKEAINYPNMYQDIFSKPAYNLFFFDQNNLAIVNEDGIYNYNLTTMQVQFIESTETKGVISKQVDHFFDANTEDKESYYMSGFESLVKYSKFTGKITNFHQLPKSAQLKSGPTDIYRDGDRLWVTYANYGIFILDAITGDKIKFISEQSINANTVMDIFPDKKGNMWFTSNKGLIRINKENFVTRHFGGKDGFATSEFNGGTKTILNSGEVILGSVKGVFQFNPNDIDSLQKKSVKPHITNISLLSNQIKPQYGSFNDYYLELQYDDFGLKVEFSALLYDKPKQVEYKYWFKNNGSSDAITIKKNELFFPSIPPGEETLFISTVDNLTGEISEPTKIEISSYPAPWLSNKAFIFYFILFLLLISVSVYRYRRRMLAKNLAHKRLMQSEERLNLALKGGDSGLWDWHAESNSVYEPRILDVSSESTFDDESRPFEQRLMAIHSDDREKITESWKQFITSGKEVFDAVYRMKNSDGKWAWYRDMATVTQFDEAQCPSRVTGTFTNITERKEARDKMRLYSKAFENTRDIVFLLNQEKKIIAANHAFYKITQYVAGEIIEKGIGFITDFDGNKKLLAQIFKDIHNQKHWEGEGQLIRKEKSPIPMVINATSFFDNDNNLNFVFALTDIRKQKRAENELTKLANYDSLTGLPNRALVLDRITHAIEHCRRKNTQMAVFFLDLDRFKQVNDSLGHDIGDLLLIYVAHTLRRSIRHYDTVARLGGDEFVVLLEDTSGVDSINRIAKNIIQQMKVPMQLRENTIACSPSIGIAIYPVDGDDATKLLKNADIAMYHAKNAGRNNFQYFEYSMNHKAKKRLLLESKLRLAIENNEIFYEYQPQYTIQSGEICGMEALARWKTPDGEFISPTEFIPVAEDLGLIIPMTELLLEAGFKVLSKWHQRGIKIGIAFNLSAKHLHHCDFNIFVDQLLARYEINTAYLEFELTESILMQDVNIACRIFGKLAEKGIELALDDFGTGYSSLKYLTQLPIKKLKIDRSFVKNIATSLENDTIIKTIISLAKSLNLKTVAEGVETQAQLDFLKDAGVDQAQGLLLEKPLPLEKIENLIMK